MSGSGVQFREGPGGRRSSLPTNRAVWADAVRPVDDGLAERIEQTTSWRQDYPRLVREVTIAGARSARAAQAIAEAGLRSARSRLEFVREGSTMPASEASDAAPALELGTHTVRGRAARVQELAVPYLGELLTGDALRRRIGSWVAHGIIEPSAATALGTVVDHPEWLGLEGRRVLLLGAGAQTSPLPVLTSWGAEVLAVDLPGDDVQQRLLKTAEEGASVVHLPVRPGRGDVTARAGANLIQDVPELARWSHGFADLPLVLGLYVYADGPLHVQATLAADVLGTALADAGTDLALAYAGTPSDCYLVPLDAVEDSNARRRSRPRRALELPVRAASFGRLYSPAYPRLVRSDDGEAMGVADALVAQQGPNYALAKRLQRWRAITAWRQGRQASFNVAPPTWTVSVTKNKLLAAGYYGARRVGLEVFAPETMRTLMTALLVHDLHTPLPAAHPELLVARSGVHGGYWRVPHNIRTTLLYSALTGLPRAYVPTIRFR